MEKLDISLLFKKPEFEKEAILMIEPLAPLSMVASMPGSFYKTLSEPSNFMIYGMIENLLGWHFPDNVRRDIFKKIEKNWKKNLKTEVVIKLSSNVGYQPIIQNHILIEHPVFLKPHVEYYEDYWTQHLKDSDRRHLGGSRNYSWDVEEILSKARQEFEKANNNLKLELEKDSKNELLKKSITELKTLYEANQTENFKDNKDKFPKYYSSPKKREFIIVDGKYGYKIKTSNAILEFLKDAITNNQAPTHLGTNEGWVDATIIEI